jgi:D,D-heptose 1,7-bisphosphate phosphatase
MKKQLANSESSRTMKNGNINSLPGAVFLDRDGTVNHDKGYISRPEDFNIYPYAGKAIKMLNDLRMLVFIVTNQSGVARGYYTLDDLDKIHSRMKEQLAEQGASIDGIYISPYFSEGTVDPYVVDHEDRKPNLGLFKKARREFSFSPKDSFMIGDRYSDIVFGKRAGLTTILVLTGDGEKEFLNNRKDWEYSPDYIVRDLLVAAKFIKTGRYCLR